MCPSGANGVSAEPGHLTLWPLHQGGLPLLILILLPRETLTATTSVNSEHFCSFPVADFALMS